MEEGKKEKKEGTEMEGQKEGGWLSSSGSIVNSS